MSQSSTAGSAERYGWVMAAVAALFLGAGNGSLVTIAVFLTPLSTESGIISLGVLIPLVLLVRTPPIQAEVQAARRREGSSIRQHASSVAPPIIVVWLSVAAIFCCICMATPMIHVVALARDMGIDAQSAASGLSLVFIAGVFGRLTFGKLADQLGGIRAYILASASQTALVFWFTQMSSLAGFYILAVLFGLANSGVMTCLMVCVQERIPIHRRGMSIGIVTLFAWLGMGLGGFQGGFFFDWTGNYTVSYANAALSGVVNLLIFGAFVYYITRKHTAIPPLEVS